MNASMITDQINLAITELLAVANLKPGHILVVGCSTSEVLGHKIGSYTSGEVAQAIMTGLSQCLKEHQIFIAIQCCEHLNRALVVEEVCAEKYNLDIVSVVPHAKAGGSLAAEAMRQFKTPVVVENIKANAGLDIGDTLIGMHLKQVAIPVRLSVKQIGAAHLTAAQVRPKLIGGERAKYCL